MARYTHGTITLTEQTTWPNGAIVTRTITIQRAGVPGGTPAQVNGRNVIDSEMLWTSERASKRATARLEAT